MRRRERAGTRETGGRGRHRHRGGVAGLVTVLCGALAVAAAPGAWGSGDASSTDFDPANFHRATTIDNRFLPFSPGMQYVLRGQADRGAGVLPHDVVLTITDLVKRVDGVWTVVLWDRDINDGELSEAELAFEAQDDQGNVWNLGEYPEEYEDGVLVGAPSTWLAGVDGARPGIHMRANPVVGSSPYVQGHSPTIGFYDKAVVAATGQTTCVPLGCYGGVLVVDEWNPAEPLGGHQLKYYAPGVGNVRIEPVDDPEGETLLLLSARRLSPRELRDARNQALALDRRGYQVSPDVYGTSEPARLPG